jgi:protein subunit release factor B
MYLLFSLTKKDFIRQTFRVGGNGGQNVNKVETGVRFIHPPSGAVAESRVFRTQHQNEVEAFKKIANSEKLQLWLKTEAARRMGQQLRESEEQVRARIDKIISDGLRSGEIKIEYVKWEKDDDYMS